MQPINKQTCHFCVAGPVMSKAGGKILKLPVLTIDPVTNNVLDTIELFCKGNSADDLLALEFIKGDYGYCEGHVTFSKGRPSDISPIILDKLPSGTIKFDNLHFDETNNVLYTFIGGTRRDYDDKGNKIFENGKSNYQPKKETLSFKELNYQERVKKIRKEALTLDLE